MNKENCALKLADEISLYYDARSKKHQIKNECFYNTTAVYVFIYGTNIGITGPKVYLFQYRRFLKFVISVY